MPKFMHGTGRYLTEMKSLEKLYQIAVRQIKVEMQKTALPHLCPTFMRTSTTTLGQCSSIFLNLFENLTAVFVSKKNESYEELVCLYYTTFLPTRR